MASNVMTRTWATGKQDEVLTRGGWIEHNGKFLPDHARLSDMVRVRFRDGEETQAAEPVRHWAGTASNWTWDRRHPSPSEIVAYEVVRP